VGRCRAQASSDDNKPQVFLVTGQPQDSAKFPLYISYSFPSAYLAAGGNQKPVLASRSIKVRRPVGMAVMLEESGYLLWRYAHDR
jgi:hypothetical protein